MNVLKKYLYFDFDIIERNIDCSNCYIKVGRIEQRSIRDGCCTEVIEVVFINKENFHVIGFVIFGKLSKDVYEMTRMQFNNDTLDRYGEKFIGIPLHENDLMYLKEKNGIFEI